MLAFLLFVLHLLKYAHEVRLQLLYVLLPHLGYYWSLLKLTAKPIPADPGCYQTLSCSTWLAAVGLLY